MFHIFPSRSLSPLLPSPLNPLFPSCYADDINIFFQDSSEIPHILDCISSFAEVSNEHPDLSTCANLPLGICRNDPIPSDLLVSYIPVHFAHFVLRVFLFPSETHYFTWQQIVPAPERKVHLGSVTLQSIIASLFHHPKIPVPNFISPTAPLYVVCNSPSPSQFHVK